MSDKVYKIRNKRTGQWSNGTGSPEWRTKGARVVTE